MKKIKFLALLLVSTLTSYAQDNWQTYNTGFADVSGIIHAPAPDTLFIHRTDGSLLRSFNGGGGRAVQVVPRPARHHGADPADRDRRDARPRVAGSTIYRHLHDRHDRTGRYYRAQLHPAGGFY